MSTNKKSSKPTQVEVRKRIADQALPEVKKLVRKYGRTAINSCLTKLHEYEKTVERLANVKAEAARLERELSK